jgi:CheY-like chemotaxis protein
VLLVEDEVATLDALATLLRMDGWDVVSANDGQEALEQLAQRRPDLIVTDYMMPNVDGLQMIEQIKANPQLADIPIVLMSAARLQRKSRGQVEAFLAKPIDLVELREVMTTLVRRESGGSGSHPDL